MKICGITAEYNPFHKGHAYQIAKARRAGATHILAVMSGNFVQRGAPAILDKWTRTQAALRGGVDLVIELPLPFATASAEAFSYGALSLMQAAGCVDMVSFGAEDPLGRLQSVLSVLLSDRFEPVLRARLGEGGSYAAARAKAVEDLAGKEAAALLERPNNILALEYLKAAHRLDFFPEWNAVLRQGAQHDQAGLQGGFMSATYLRSLLEQNDWDEAEKGLTEAGRIIYRQAFLAGRGPVRLETLERSMLSALRNRSLEQLRALPDMGEGLENRLYTGIRQAVSIPQLYGLIRSKRYPHSRARRMVLHAFLDVTAKMLESPPPYLRILGIGGKGGEILKRMKEKARLPLSQSLHELQNLGGDARAFAVLEASATDQYVLGMPKPLSCGWEFTASLVKEKEESLC